MDHSQLKKKKKKKKDHGVPTSESKIWPGKELAAAKKRGRGRPRNGSSPVPYPKQAKESSEQKGGDNNKR